MKDLLSRWRSWAPMATVCCVVFLLAAAIGAAAATSAETETRLDSIEILTTRLEARLERLGGRAGSSDRLCDEGAVAAQTALEGRLREAASRQSLEWRDLAFDTRSEDDLTVVNVVGRIEGPYDSTVRVLERLATSGPTLFVRSATFEQNAAGVALNLEATQLCSSSLR